MIDKKLSDFLPDKNSSYLKSLINKVKSKILLQKRCCNS